MDGAFSGTLDRNSQTDFTPLRADAPDGQVRLPSGEDFLRADFVRSGPDLLIETPSGGHYVLPGYFQAAEPPALETFDGAVLGAKLVAALAGPAAPAMWAQAAAQQGPNLGEPIGQVSAAQGGVTVRHADGTQSVLAAGSSIFQGDVLETGAGAHVGIVFVDDTVFSLDENGRMVMDEMVYDPDTQTGVFNAQVVQGVFSFVSGQVAKTSPEGMVVSTPTNTIGIRGSTVLGRAAAEGAENKITLVRDVDGNVGEIIISNGAGTLVLNQAGASLTVFSFNAPLPTPVILSPAQIQQDFGVTLTRLTQVVAQKAESDVARVQEQAQRTGEEAQQAQDEAQQAQDEAQQAEEGAQQADAEAEAAQAEAEAAQAEAEAAKAEAEAKGDAEATAKAQAAEAKAQEAVAKAQAAETKAQAEAAKAQTVKAQAEAKTQEAAAKAAEAAQMQVQAQKVAEFTAVAKTAADAQAKVFQEMVNTGIIQLPPGVTAADVMSFGPGPGGPQGPLSPQGPQEGPQAGLADTVAEGPDAAARAAFDQAIAGGATPEQAAEAAALAAQGAMQQFGFQQQPVGMPGVGYDPFMGGFMNPFGMPGMDPFGGPGLDPMAGMFGDPFGGPYMDPMAGMYMDPYAVAYDPLLGGTIDLFNFFDPTDLYNMFATFDPYGVVSYFIDNTDTNITTVFGETIIAPSSGAYMSGTYLNTNFYFQWPSLSGAYTVSDAGGINQLSLDNLSNATVRVVMGATATSGNIKIWTGGLTGDSEIPNKDTAAAAATISFSNVNQFLLADVSVASFATVDFVTSEQKAASGDVLVLQSMSAGETGFVIAGTSGIDSITVDYTLKGAIIFGKGGADTFLFTSTASKNVTAIGGDTIGTDNEDDGSNGGTAGDGIPDAFINIFSYAGMTSYTSGSPGLAVLLGDQYNPNDVSVTDYTTHNDSTPGNDLFSHDLWDVGKFIASPGDDYLTINYSNYAGIEGGAGNDTFVSGGGIDKLTGGTGSDIFVYTQVGQSEVGASDIITDFDAGGSTTAVDKIKISALVQGTFSYVGTTAFSANAGNTQARFDTGTTSVQIDVDGSGTMTTADLQITLQSDLSASFDSGDFIIV